jgi:UDP-glucose 4-epimerase
MPSQAKKSPAIMITGASGLIGSGLVMALKDLGCEQLIPCARGDHERLAKEFNMPVQHWDILSNTHPSIDQKVDLIVHCATANDIISSRFESGMDLTLNGTKTILDYAVKNQIKDVFFLSTIQVYGTTLNGEVSLKSGLQCESQYALNHYFGEELCRMYCLQFGLRITIIRPTNVYGVPSVTTVDRDTLVPACFVKEALIEGAIRLRSSGEQYRNFISTHEVAYSIWDLINSIGFGGGIRTVNIASDFNFSIGAAAELVANAYQDIFGTSLPISYGPGSPHDENIFTVANDSNVFRLSKKESEELFKKVIMGLLKRGVEC